MQQSLNLVQNLLLATIGSISYVRVLFPDPYFHKKNVQGQSIQAIRRKASHESDQLLHWIEQGCFDALKKGYLKSLVFGIYETDPSDLIESYEFKFFYPEDGYSMSFGNTRFDLTRDKITLETTQMIRRLLLLTESLDPLPSVKYMTMRMTYYDHCPPDYAGDPSLLVSGNSIQMGSIQTHYHQVSLQVFSQLTREDSQDTRQCFSQKRVIDCLCKLEDEQDLFQCATCKIWKHQQCHQPKKDRTVCLSCEFSVNDQISTLCLVRRAIKLLEQPISLRELKYALNVSPKEASLIQDMLLKYDLVQINKSIRKKANPKMKLKDDYQMARRIRFINSKALVQQLLQPQEKKIKLSTAKEDYKC